MNPLIPAFSNSDYIHIVPHGPDQTYDYVDCARGPGKANYFFSPTAPLPVSSSTGATNLPAAKQSVSTTSQPATVSTTQSEDTSSPASGEAGRSTENGDQRQSNTGAIVGGAIGGLAIVLGIVWTVIYRFRHTRLKRHQQTEGETIEWDISHTTVVAGNSKYQVYGELPAEYATQLASGDKPQKATLSPMELP